MISWPYFETQTPFLDAAKNVAHPYLLKPHALRGEILDLINESSIFALEFHFSLLHAV